MALESLPKPVSGVPEDPLVSISRWPVRLAIKMILIVGFGGLIAIVVAGGVYSLRVARQIQVRSQALRTDFLSRERMLEAIRSDLFESGNVIRDYILTGSDEKGAIFFRSDLEAIETDVRSQLSAYSQSLRPAESEAFQKLSAELASYWSVLAPALEWNAQQRKSRGDSFLRDEILPRRTVLLTIAKETGQVNARALQEEEAAIGNTFLESENRLQIVSILGVSVGVILALITALYTLHLEGISERRYEQSVRIQDELKQLSAKLVDAQESERRAISRELHDEVGQSLSSLLMEIDTLAAGSPVGDGLAPQSLQKLRDLAQGTLHVVRDMSLLLRPSMLDDLGLVPALEWQAREVYRRTGLPVAVVESNVSDDLSDDYKTCIYRIVQEALNNASKHAHATHVDLAVRQEPHQIVLTIQDNGTGYDSRRVRGLGILGLFERVNRLRGRLHIESKQGSGTLLRVELPLPPSAVTSQKGLS